MLYVEQIKQLSQQEAPIVRFLADSTAAYVNFTESKTGIMAAPCTIRSRWRPSSRRNCSRSKNITWMWTSPAVSRWASTFADFYHTTDQPANMKVALDVRGEEFVELFLQRMQNFES